MCGPCSDGTYWVDQDEREESIDEYMDRVYGNDCASCGGPLGHCSCMKEWTDD